MTCDLRGVYGEWFGSAVRQGRPQPRIVCFCLRFALYLFSVLHERSTYTGSHHPAAKRHGFKIHASGIDITKVGLKEIVVYKSYEIQLVSQSQCTYASCSRTVICHDLFLAITTRNYQLGSIVRVRSRGRTYSINRYQFRYSSGHKLSANHANLGHVTAAFGCWP